jgi:hypothetical protein
VFNGVFYGGWGKINPVAGMPTGGETRRVQARATSQVEDAGFFPGEEDAMDPFHMLFNPYCAAAGSIVPLREMLLQHAAAEIWVIPGDFLALSPGRWGRITLDDIVELHSNRAK